AGKPPPRLIPSCAVIATSGSAADSRTDKVLGLGANNFTSASTYWASVPPEPRTPPTQPNTSSPGANSVTPSPTASTTPATSHPIVAGKAAPNGVPLQILISTGLADAAPARIRTVPWPTRGMGRSSRDRFSRPPNFLKTTAFIVDSAQERGEKPESRLSGTIIGDCKKPARTRGK